MVKALFDTNILIDHLNAVPEARAELERYREWAISIVTWMEVMVGADESVAAPTRAFLRSFAILQLDDRVAERAVELRKSHGIKLPDAIVWASADINSMLLVTRNTRDFRGEIPGVRVPYVI